MQPFYRSDMTTRYLLSANVYSIDSGKSDAPRGRAYPP